MEGHSRKKCRSKNIERGKEFNNGPSKKRIPPQQKEGMCNSSSSTHVDHDV